MNIVSDRLTESERNELLRVEGIIRKGFVHMRECAEALLIIKDNRLYREEFETFKDYCQVKWKRESQTVYLMLKAHVLRKEMVNAFTTEPGLQTLIEDTSDSAIRELGKVPKRSRKRVFKTAAKLAKKDKEIRKEIRVASNGRIAALESKLNALPRGGLAAEAARGKIEAELKVLRGEDEAPSPVPRSNGMPRVPRPSVLDAPSAGWKVRVLEAFDRGIEAILEEYRSTKAVATAIRELLATL